LAAYKINEDGRVDYSYNPAGNEKILTSTSRPLTLHDIYFLFSSRIFPDKTPFTAAELSRFGIEEYNPYEILRKTHGINPADSYWFKFSDDNITYKAALEEYEAYFVQPAGEAQETEAADGETEAVPVSDISSILNQNELDVNSLSDELKSNPDSYKGFYFDKDGNPKEDDSIFMKKNKK
jgi:hypothetical protein